MFTLNFGNLISGVHCHPNPNHQLWWRQKLVLDNLPHFIRMELWDAPSGIAIVSNSSTTSSLMTRLEYRIRRRRVPAALS